MPLQILASPPSPLNHSIGCRSSLLRQPRKGRGGSPGSKLDMQRWRLGSARLRCHNRQPRLPPRGTSFWPVDRRQVGEWRLPCNWKRVAHQLRAPEPPGGLRVVPLNTFAVQVHFAEFQPGVSVVLLCSLAEPPKRLGIILAIIFGSRLIAVLVEQAQLEIRFRIAAFGLLPVSVHLGRIQRIPCLRKGQRSSAECDAHKRE